MYEPRLSLAFAAPSILRFAILTALILLRALLFLAQQKPIPAELSFPNKLARPCRIIRGPGPYSLFRFLNWANTNHRRKS